MALELSQTELWHAYRRAKSDCRYERIQNGAVDYADFEQNLSERLDDFAFRARQGSAVLFPDDTAAGEAFWILKGSTSAELPMNHVVVDPDDRWDSSSPHEFTFRPVCKPSIHAQLLSALWLMRVGSRIDLGLGSSCFGNRLRRVFGSGEVNLTAYSSFKHYAQPYQAWRNTALLTAERHLDGGESVVVVTFDIKNCYPSLLCQNVFEAVAQEFGLDPLSELLRGCVGGLNRIVGTEGLPIGLTASAVLANYCLAEIDHWFAGHPSVHYYGRYVDDVALVLPAELASSPSVLLATLAQLSGGCISPGESGDWRIGLPKVGLSLGVSASKTRVIRLAGATGKAMLASIRRDGSLIASEWRLLPKAMEFSGTAAKLLRFSRDHETGSAKLRDIDTSSINRFAFSTALRHVAVLVHALDRVEATKVSRDVLVTAIRHAVSATNAHEFLSYWKRLLVLVLALGDESIVELMVVSLTGARDRLLAAVAGSSRSVERQRMDSFVSFVGASIFEAVVTAFADPQVRASALARFVAAGWSLAGENAEEGFRRVFWSDLASVSISQYILGSFHLEVPPPGRTRVSVPVSSRESVAFCREIGRSKRLSGAELHRRFALSTRPPRWADVFRASEAARRDEAFAARVYEAFRGFSPEFQRRSLSPATLRVALSSFVVTEAQWKGAAIGSPELTGARFDAVAEIVRTAQKHKANLLVFPELSIPRRWIELIESYLELSRISLVAGLEYSHHGFDSGGGRIVANEAAVSIVETTRSGFTRHRPHRQRKMQAAIGEELELCALGAVHLNGIERRPVYEVNGVRFAVFVCSELTDSLERARMRGLVDAVFAIEYNRDLQTFRALTDSTSLDLHCFVVQCNNRRYGDSRIRSPASREFERELAALRGGINDHVVLVDLPVRALREFQARPRTSQVERDTGSEHSARRRELGFKPVPDGWRRR